MSGDSGQAIRIAPLTKRREESGELYTRRPEVEAQLQEVVGLSAEELSPRLKLPNREASGYLFDETLVYLFREARRKEDLTMEYLIYDQLAVRVETLVRGHAHQASPDDPEGFIGEVHFKVLAKLLDFDSDKGDYAQVMFGDFVATIAHNEKRRIWGRRNSEPVMVEIDAPNEDGHDFDPEDEGALQDFVTILDTALAKLPEKTAVAFVMHYRDGFQIESKDPDEPTVARHFGVSGRAIRYWFTKAAKTLNDTNGGER